MTVRTDPYLFVNGTVADALQVNARFDELYDLQDGGIDGTNMNLTATFAWTGPHSFASTATFTSSATTSSPYSFTGNSITTGTLLSLTANALTSGSALTVTSTSTSTTVRPLVKFYNNAATAAATSTVLTVESSAANGHLLLLSNTNSSSANPLLLGKLVTSATSDFVNFTQNDVERFSVTAAGSVEITSVNTTAQHAMVIVGSQTTKNALDVTADSLTTGYVGSFVSNSADTSLRYIIFGRNDHASATGVIVAKFRQDSTGNILECTNSSGTEVFAVSPTTAAITGLATITSTTTTSDVCTITASSLTTGSALVVYSNSSSSSTRNLVEITNDHASADNAVCLNIQQDGDDDGIYVVKTSAGYGLNLDSSGVNSASDYTGLLITTGNAGAGSAICIEFAGSVDDYFRFTAGVLTSAAGTYYGRYPVDVPGVGRKYTHLFNA